MPQAATLLASDARSFLTRRRSPPVRIASADAETTPVFWGPHFGEIEAGYRRSGGRCRASRDGSSPETS